MRNYKYMRRIAIRTYEFMLMMRNSQHSHVYSHFSHRSKGFALLFAILASSVLMSIGAAIWNIAFREVLLSSFGRESQSAFYVADTAIECAFYHDFVTTEVFATSSSLTLGVPCAMKSFMCSGVTLQPTLSSCDARNATSTFTMDVGSGKAIVVVGKSDPDGDGRSATNIVSHGQSSRNPLDPTIVERGLRANY
ncbi:MAG: hypothetical protein UX89_C0014G0006 [Parcubacteria group bacterium GW2011_GWA2_47_16]|nr:MAG: hypothetical protein UX89_C0014G0006 [Parcubacteria group bacterium GW2011_GWA2_47_16]